MKPRNTIIKLLATPDTLIRNAINKLTQNMIKTDRFRLTDAIACSWHIDVWQRYAGIIGEIKMMGRDCKSILDVGGSGGLILNFIRHPDLCVLDIDKTALLGSDKTQYTLDNCHSSNKN